MFQPGIGDWTTRDVEHLEVDQTLQMEPGACDSGMAQAKVLEACKPLQMHKSGIADLRVL